jgi:hypothetical protein
MSNNRHPELKIVQRSSGAGRPAGNGNGRVVHDARGNAIWDWAVATGVLAKKTVAELIHTLDEPGTLSLEHDPASLREQTGDPYNRPGRLARTSKAPKR